VKKKDAQNQKYPGKRLIIRFKKLPIYFTNISILSQTAPTNTIHNLPTNIIHTTRLSCISKNPCSSFISSQNILFACPTLSASTSSGLVLSASAITNEKILPIYF